jgi:hypothetical protein
MAEHDRVAAGEAPDEPRLPPGRRPGNVHHPDPDVLDLDYELLRQERSQRRLVGVSVDRLHRRPDRAQLLQHRHGREVAAVEDQVGPAQRLETDLGEPSGSPRQVRVRDDDYFLRQGCCFVECAPCLQSGGLVEPLLLLLLPLPLLPGLLVEPALPLPAGVQST